MIERNHHIPYRLIIRHQYALVSEQKLMMIAENFM